MYLAYIGTSEDGHSVAGTFSLYSRPDCDFAVGCPGEPSITQLGDEGVLFEQASLMVPPEDVYLRAECGRPRKPGLDQDWVLNMSLFMRADGMEPITTEQKPTTLDGVPVILAEGSAHHNFGEIEATVNMQVIASNASFLVLYAVRPSDGELSPDAWHFLRSYSPAGNSMP